MGNVFKQPCDEGLIRSSHRDQPCDRARGRWILAATILGSSMAFIDGTVVNVALPVLQTDLGADVSDLQWIVESYAVMLSSLLLVGGSLGDRLGRRRIFAVGILIFASASVWCGLSPDTGNLIFARAFQGIGGALLIPASLALIGALFSEKERGRAIGTWSAFTAITAAVGPVLGGWLIENASWRWVFFINVPVAAFVITILFWKVPESRDDEKSSRLDLWGSALATLGLGGFVFGLVEAQNLGLTHPLILACLGFGALALAGFVRLQQKLKDPMVPPGLFASRDFTGANLLTLLLYMALGGALFFFPFNLIQVQGYSATAAGAAFLPFILILFLLSRWAGGLVTRFGARVPLTVGPLVAAVGFFLFTLPGIGGSYWETFFPAVIVLGIGMAISVAPLTTTVMSSAPTRYAGVASGVNNAVSRTAAVLAVALFGLIMMASFSAVLDARLEEASIPADIRLRLEAESIKLAGAEIPAEADEATASVLRTSIARAFVESFRLLMFLAAGLSILSGLVAWVMIGKEKPEAGSKSGSVG